MPCNKQNYKKKGFAEQVVGAVITLISGMAIAGLVLIFTGSLGGQTYNLVEPDINSIGNTSATGISLTGSNVTAASLGHSYIHSGSLAITNNSINAGLGNFTIDYTAGTILVKTGAPSALYQGQTLTANYTWGDTTIRSYVKESITSAFKAQKQTGTYLPIIVLAVVISLVLMLVLGMTAVTSGGYRGGSAL